MRPITLFTGYDRRDLLWQLREAGWPVARVVVPNSGKYLPSLGPMLAEALRLGLDVLCVVPSDADHRAEELKDPGGILLSAGYPFVIPASVFEGYRYAINVHPTLLPRHRGRYLNWILLDNESESGVTVHAITEQLDGGPILRQERFVVSPFDTLASLKRKSRNMEWAVIRDALGDLLTDTPAFQDQDEALATVHVKARLPEHSQMAPDTTLVDALNVVRASNEVTFPAYFVVDGEKIRVRMDRLDKPADEEDMI